MILSLLEKIIIVVFQLHSASVGDTIVMEMMILTDDTNPGDIFACLLSYLDIFSCLQE